MLERAGIQRADLVIAVTGDDEDNILICQVAKEKFGVQRIVARVNNPRNLQHFRLLGIQPAVSATDLILRLIEHEVPEYGLIQLLALEEEHLEIIEVEVAEGSPAAGRRVQDVALPDGSLVISVLRGGAGFVPKADSVIEAGDQVLLILDPGLESRDHAPVRDGRRPQRCLTATSTTADRRRAGGGQLRAVAARVRAPTARSCSIGREPDLPYNRPPCSKGYLQGKESREDVLFRPSQWYEEQEIEALTRVSAMKLDTAEKVVTLSNREDASASTRRCSRPAPTSSGSTSKARELEGIHYLRRSATATRSARTRRASAWC